MMRWLTRREMITGCFSLTIICCVLIILYLGRSATVSHEDSFGDISVYFSAEKSRVLLPNDCIILSWRVRGANQVYLDDVKVEAIGFDEYCLTSSKMPLLKVNYGVELNRIYRLPITIAIFEMEFILLLSVIVLAFSVGIGLLFGGWLGVVQITVGAWFGVWALDFIMNRTTFRLFDGQRYFALFDDAMISMRYAWNFVNGHGLVWNVGERVEGYSNLLMVIVMMPANLLFSKGGAVFVMHLFGLFMMLLIAYLTVKIASRLFLSDSSSHQSLQKVLFFAVALSYYPLTYWSLMGMETSLLTVMMLLTFWAMLNDRPYQMALFAGLTYLTRQDGLLLVLPIMIYWMMSQPRQSKRVVGLSFGLFVLFAIGQQVFRVLYYGEWLPNTYIMKVSGIPLAHRLIDGMEYVLLFASSMAFVWVVNGIGGLLRPDGKKLLIASIMALLMAYQVYVGGDAWLYWRLFSPIMPLMLAWFVHEVVMFSVPYAKHYASALIVLIVGVVLAVGPNQRFLPEITRKTIPYDVNLHEPLLKSSLALNELVTEDAQVGVVMAGIVPYYTGLYAIDYLGKSDPIIAQLPPDLSGSVAWLGRTNIPGHLKYDLYYSLQQLQPDFTQRCSWGHQNLCPYAELYYRRIDYYGHEIWLRRGSPHVRWNLIDDLYPTASAGLSGFVKPLDYRLETGIYILGVEMSDSVRWHGSLNIQLSLSADHPQDLYIMAYEFVDETGHTVLKSETTRINPPYTTADLKVDLLTTSHYEIQLPYDVVRGRYSVYLSFYHPATLEHLQVVDGKGEVMGDRVLLGEVQVID